MSSQIMSFVWKQIWQKIDLKITNLTAKPMWVIVFLALSISSIVYPRYIQLLLLELFSFHTLLLDIITGTRQTDMSTSLRLLNLKTNCFYYILMLFLFKTIFIDPPRMKYLELYKLLTMLGMTTFHVLCIYLLKLIPKLNVSDHTWPKDVSMRASRWLLVFQIAASVTSRQHKYRWESDNVSNMCRCNRGLIWGKCSLLGCASKADLMSDWAGS